LPDDFLGNYWRKPGDNAKYGKLTTKDNFNSESDREIIDASYLRLQNLSFAYRLPEKLIKKAGISDCRFSLQAQNIFTLSSYKIDPDIRGTYFSPMPRVIQGTFSFTL